MQTNSRKMTATWLREGRQSKGLTQKELSERSNISIRSIQRIENGEITPRSHTLKTLAAILGLSFEEFMKTARELNIYIKDDEGQEISLVPTPARSIPQRIILSLGLCGIILFLSIAYVSQAKSFPETTFEGMVFSATVLTMLTVVLYILWKK